MSSFNQAIENITPEIYQQAVIAWELQNLPEEKRTGYMGPQHCSSHSDEPIPNILFKSDSVH